MGLKSFFIIISIVLVPLFSVTSFVTDEVDKNIDPTVCIEEGSNDSNCITACCYVIFNRSYDENGNQVCQSDGTTHCSECCMQNCALPGEELPPGDNP
ncbi:MAG TPA: hypothetical protein VFM80_10325 [Gracilimonas sp.]|uniref:hypothetical protein n=1 Tax=Gracilimonas sp. TaxID=1974203 RepID=UPI002D83593C|nr:hypothetical protein [Gracilimonas sp.]